jgi:hypothetical protein
MRRRSRRKWLVEDAHSHDQGLLLVMVWTVSILHTVYGVDALPIELLDRELWHEEWNQEATYLRMTIERATLFVKHAATFLTFQLEKHQHIEEVFGASCTPYVYSRLRSRAWAWAP